MPFPPSNWTADALARLAKSPASYHVGGPAAAEPSAFVALAFLGAGRTDDAKPHLKWLAETQTRGDGSSPPLLGLQWPAWPTPLAIIACVVARQSGIGDCGIQMERAKQWLLSAKGTTLEKAPEFGHDAKLVGWPWVIGTHSWQEPTAWSVLALRSLRLAAHPRTREGVRLLIDRLLPEGGCNYGNTYVLGQKLRPQVQPSGFALLALAGEDSDDPRIGRTVKYVASAISDETTPMTLSYGLLGLAAYHRALPDAAAWLESAYAHTIKREPSPLTIALLVLAAQGDDCPLIKHSRTERI